MQIRDIRVLCVAAAVAGLFALAPAPLAGQETGPKASEIIAKYIDALGGEAAHKAITSIHATGTCEISAQNLSGPIEMFAARPGKALLRVTLPGIGKIENGYDGKVAWEISPVTGPSLIKGRRLTETMDESWFDSVLHAPDHVKEMTTLARATFDGHAAWPVKVQYLSGTEIVEYFDVETGLMLGSEATRETGMGVVPTTSLLRDYRKFGGVLESTTMSTKVMGFEQVLHITSFEYDKVPAATFDPPPAVKALIGK